MLVCYSIAIAAVMRTRAAILTSTDCASDIFAAAKFITPVLRRAA